MKKNWRNKPPKLLSKKQSAFLFAICFLILVAAIGALIYLNL